MPIQEYYTSKACTTQLNPLVQEAVRAQNHRMALLEKDHNDHLVLMGTPAHTWEAKFILASMWRTMKLLSEMFD